MGRVALAVGEGCCRLLLQKWLSYSCQSTKGNIYQFSKAYFYVIVVCIVFVSSTDARLPHTDPSAPALCQDKSLEEREELATVVVTGTVKKIMSDERTANSGLYKSEVEIKRVFKGDEVVNELANIYLDPIRHHKMVMVDGFGNPRICENTVHLADTKIFLLNKGSNGELKLNSSILPITLTNLDYTEAVVKDVPFKPEKAPPLSPCEVYFCAFGAVCMVNISSGKPYCQCQQECQSIFAPVCGTDNATYANPCLLDKASCLHQRRIKVQRPGLCSVRDPCEGKPCSLFAKCVPSIDGTTARCQCPTQCHRYGDNVGSKPVCGSDGKDYDSMCDLHKAACNGMHDIGVRYYGKCDPCEGFQCEAPEVCQLDEQRMPVCRCKFLCFKDLEPVCGTDGKTYSNECVLLKEACKQHKDIKVLYKGECSIANNPCERIHCGPMEECSVNRNGVASCVCPIYCEPIIRYVCGNNSRTYDSECELRKQACLLKEYVSVAHTGQCGHDVPCREYPCTNGAVCVVKDGRPTCKCPQCSEHYDPVCGDDGITYENECKLQQENCETSRAVVRVKSRGACTSCGPSQCQFHAICEKINNKPTCTCPSSCIKVDLPVCASNGVTYPNECEMRLISCRTQKFITKSSLGSCDKCAGVVCKFGAKCENGVCVCPVLCPTMRESVCGSDGKTYINECDMRKSACSQNKDIEVAPDSNCDDLDFTSGSGEGSGDDISEDCLEESCSKYGGKCTTKQDGSLQCTCNFNCDAVRSPVCGSDGKTYGNECQMRQAMCSKRQEIVSVSMDSCDEFDNDEPCDGVVPLVNEKTGQDYNCMPGADMCPSGSYCHITPVFAKCCREDIHISKKCSDTFFGCCKDGKTAAQGPNNAGCPEFCHCNAIGSYETSCDPATRQCACKPGVGGFRCDRCDIGYWGLHKITEDGNPGCIQCNCNPIGSDRDDCEQMTGRCMCKPLISGMKCDMCNNGRLLGSQGCEGTADLTRPLTCDELVCHFGAVCRRQANGVPACACDFRCDSGERNQNMVCGNDSQNYGSECELKLFGCRLQKDISVAYHGPCKAQPATRTTTTPPSTSRSRKTTRHIDGEAPESDGSALSPGTKKPDSRNGDPVCQGSYIDGLCLSDADCCSNHSQCRLGLCRCLPSYVPSVDNRKCIEVTTGSPITLAPEKDACADNPCYGNGQCELDKLLGFRCICPLGRSGPLCNKESDFKVPSFSGRSYIELPRIKRANRDLSLEIVFQTLNKDGIILFNSQNSNGTGDFVSLTVRDGFVEFRFDLGAGEAILRSRNPVEPGRSHRVIARRMHASGILVVDNDQDVTGNSASTHTSLDLIDPLYIGFIPKVAQEIYDQVGVDLGLVGCIHSLRAGSGDEMYSYNLELNSLSSDIISGADISECGSNPCKSMPCMNQGTCLVLDAEMFDCKCLEGYKGVLCQELVDACASQPCQHEGICIKSSLPEGFQCKCTEGREGSRCEREAMPKLFVPQFTGSSYMEIPLDGNVGKMLSIEVWFRPLQPNGVLFFASQFENGLGDFISLNLVRKTLQFKYHLGAGIATIEDKKPLLLDKWHKVLVSRDGRDGQLVVNSQTAITGQSPGQLTELNLGQTIFIGGFGSKSDIPNDSGIETGFTGAIQRVIIKGHAVDNLMASAKKMSNITEYNGPPCNVNPCLNGGVCIPMLNSAECHCQYNYMGQHCEKRAEHVDKDQPVKFEGNTFLNYPSEVKRR